MSFGTDRRGAGESDVGFNLNVVKYEPMMKTRYGCAICGKGVQHTNLVSFSKNRVHKIRRPNLHTHHMVVAGESIKVKLCTSCKRLVRLAERKEAVVPVVVNKSK